MAVVDHEFRLVQVNARWSSLLGYPAEELQGRNLLEIVHKDDGEYTRHALLRALKGKQITAELRLKDAQGKHRWLWFTGTQPDGSKRLYLIGRDTSRHRMRLEALEDSEQQAQDQLQIKSRWFDRLLEHSSDLISLIDSEGTRLFESPAATKVLQYPMHELLGEYFWQIIHPDDQEQAKRDFEKVKGRPGGQITTEFRVRSPSGSYIFLESIVTNLLDDPLISGIIFNSRDVTERRLLDPTTGLPNRRYFVNQLDRCLARLASAPERNFAAFTVGIDRFRTIEHSLGECEANQLLSQVGERIRAWAREDDLVARTGGDIFGILMQGPENQEIALEIAERLRKQLTAPFKVADQLLVLTVGIGIVVSSPDCESGSSILRDCETSMQTAKRSGPGKVQAFSKRMRDNTRSHLFWESALRQAIDKEEFVVHFQPIVRLADNSIEGFEALVRWPDQNGKLVSPGTFIPVAESSGLITSIDHIVIRKAAVELSKWRENYPALNLRLNVNLSASHFETPKLKPALLEVLCQTGLSADCLKLEVTETALIQNPQSAADVLKDLRKIGFGLSLDDFGTGYSSLSYLHRYPFDTLKVDRSFISKLGSGQGNLELVRSIYMLARSLEMKVVAEGIEEPEQRDMLRELGCDFAQGFYFSRPLPTSAIDELLKKPVAW